MEIKAKQIGELIANQIKENFKETFAIEYGESYVEIVYNGQWYKNKAVFKSECGEELLYFFAWNTKRQEYQETVYMKCHRFLNNPAFWAGYVCGGLMEAKRLD